MLASVFKLNTSLKTISLGCGYKWFFLNGRQKYFTCPVHHNSIGNQIRETGAASLSEALKVNTQLYELNLRGECTKQIITL